MLSKIKIILLSRFKTNKEEKWVRDRQKICLSCENNSINSGGFNIYRFFLATLSTLLSFFTGKLKVDGSIGYCKICGCDNYFKTIIDAEKCSDNPPRWEKLEDNSIQLDIINHRKNESNKSNR